MENLDPNTEGNQDPQAPAAPAPPAPAAPAAPDPAASATSWKSKLGEDLSKAPSLGKFEDTQEGLAKIAESYVNLEKLLSNEKVPLPKGPEDVEGLAAFNRACGVPDSAEGYALPDPVMPDGIPSETFDKGSFQEIMLKHGIRPDQAEGLWNTYTDMANNMLVQGRAKFNEMLNQNVNTLRAEWGDAFAAKVELGDMVINRFADDQEMGDWLTATLGKDPRGMKFLSKIGAQFSENKIGDFKYKQFAMSPEEAGQEVAKIKADPEGAYRNDSGKFSDQEHQAAVDHVNRLIAISMGKQV